MVIALGQTDHLQPQLVLIRPEPRNGRIGLGFAANRRGDAACLFECVGHRLQAKAPTEQGIGVIGAIAGGMDLRVAGLAEVIDQNAVVDHQARFFSKLHVGH
ncbi:hypothetical protein D9M71_397900 [compost metagenome]